MGELELLSDGLDMVRTLAWMIFPRSEIHRRQHVARTKAWTACEQAGATDDVILSSTFLREILGGPGKAEMEEMATEAGKRGSVAGDLLALIYQMEAGGHTEPSFGKAIEQYKSYALGLKYGDGESLKYSEATLRAYFEDYASVAHLWAAMRINQGPYAYTANPKNLFSDQESFVHFLGVAKSIALFASTFIPKRTKPSKPIIPAEILLSIPESVAAIHLKFRLV